MAGEEMQFATVYGLMRGEADFYPTIMMMNLIEASRSGISFRHLVQALVLVEKREIVQFAKRRIAFNASYGMVRSLWSTPFCRRPISCVQIAGLPFIDSKI